MNRFNRLVIVRSPRSSRAAEYDSRIAPSLQDIAAKHSAELAEIPLNNTPYFEAVEQVHNELRTGDVILGAGGDGVNQVALQAAFESNQDITAGFLSLGNANDFARALNGRTKNPEKILSSSTINFRPLELSINGTVKFYVAAYATFGATTVAVDWLNDNKSRAHRKSFSNLPPVMALDVKDLDQISQDINSMNFPEFQHNSTTRNDDSIGFFLIPAARGLLRPKTASNFLARDSFFFHSDNVRAKSLGQGWFGKALHAGLWSMFGLPGTISDHEDLTFVKPTNLACHVGGDNIDLEQVQNISARRSQRTIKILAPNVKVDRP